MYELIVKLVCDEMNIRRCIKKSIAVHLVILIGAHSYLYSSSRIHLLHNIYWCSFRLLFLNRFSNIDRCSFRLLFLNRFSNIDWCSFLLIFLNRFSNIDCCSFRLIFLNRFSNID